MHELADRPDTEARDGALDGLRGLAIILVVLSHGWTVYSFDGIAQIAPLDSLFLAGNLAVTLFLVVSGYLVTRSMMRARTRLGASGPWWTFARRALRISASVVAMLTVLVVVWRFDSTDTSTPEATRQSALRVATYTWNWYVRDHATEARGDLGPLWYLSVEMQFYLAATIVLALWGTRRRWLVVAVVTLIAAVTWWRGHVYDLEGWYSALLRTSTRIDGLLWGALAALVMPHLARTRRWATPLLVGSSLMLTAIVMTSSQFDIGDYIKLQGALMAVTVVAFLVGSHYGPATSPVVRALSWRPLRTLGVVSLTIYVWHSPLLWGVARHTSDWADTWRTLLALALLAIVTGLTHRYIDNPVNRWTSKLGRTSAPATAFREGQPATQQSPDHTRPRDAGSEGSGG